MPVRRIFTYPDDVLHDVAEEVSEIDGATVETLDDMFTTMYAAPGIGLAAPQIGLSERMIVVDLGDEEGGGGPSKDRVELINPVITEQSDEMVTNEEGCLSIIDYRVEVTRPATVVVKGWTRDQKEIEIEADGLLSICLQHELEHLDGTLLLDHLSRLKRSMYRKRVQKALREGRPIARDSE